MTPENELAPERARALVVDDDPLFLRFCTSLLAEEGFDVVAAGSGAEAMALLSRSSFDLLVCDLLMPPPAGQEVIQHAQALAAPPAVLLVTALPESDPSLKPLYAAGWPILLKPLDPVEFARTVAWAIHARAFTGRAAPEEMGALYRMATAANSEPTIARLLDRILGICIGALHADSGSVMLASTGPARPRTLAIVTSYGLLLRPAEPPVPFGSRVSGWVAEKQRPIRLVGSLRSYPQFSGVDPKAEVSESMIAPILFRRETLGVISVNSSSPGVLGPEKMAVLAGAADIAAAAIHRERMEHAREHQDKLAVLGQLSASVAHELANPLAFIEANLNTLAELSQSPSEKDRQEIQDLLAESRSGVERMRAIVSSLRSASRKSRSQLGASDVAQLLRRAQALVHPQFKHRVKLTVDAGAAPPVQMDQNRILQVLINLLVNAGQAVDHDGQVALRSRVEGPWLLIEVEDNGPGIPEEVAPHIFEPFFTTKPDGEGTGLGLSISRQIAREHGGDLTFTSARRRTCFSLRIPLAASEQPERPVVLVMDDEPALLRAVDRALRESCDVLLASGGKQALELTSSVQPDVILVDYLMPEQDGLAALQALRDCGQSAPAALVTALAHAPEVLKAERSGLVACVIPKPWSPTGLLAQVLHLAGRG